MSEDKATKDWKEIRKDTLASARLIVVKVGSAVLTTKDGLDLRIVNRLADQLASLHDKGRQIILVTSGAVAAGKKYLVGPNREISLSEKQAAAAVGQSRLMHSYDEAFERYGKVSAQVLLTRDDLRVRHRFLNARNTFLTLIHNQVIPIVNENDTVVVQELEFGDNDYLATLILNLVQADLFINLTSAAGVYSANPEIDDQAQCFECIEDINRIDLETLCSGKSASGSGGMYSKLLGAKRAAQLGVPTLVVSGLVPFVLEKVFAGENLGTWVKPEQKQVSQRKFWLAYNLDPAGALHIDSGAKQALVMRGKSLLPAGIVQVDGEFGFGEMVKLIGPDKEQVGVGLVNFNSEEMRLIAGRKSKDLASTLHHKVVHVEAVHRDNLLLDAIH